MGVTVPGRSWRRGALILAVTLVVGYATLLRLDALFGRYGPVTHPRWLVSVQAATAAGRPLVPEGWHYSRVEKPYEGGDPINYLRYAREMRHFYQAHVREPVFLAGTRVFLTLTGDQPISVSLASLSFSVLAVLAVFLLGRAAGSNLVGIGAACALAVEHEVIGWAPSGWRDDAFMASATLFAWAAVRFSQSATWKTAVSLGVTAAVCCLTRVTALAFVVPALGMLAMWLWRGRLGDARERLRPMAVAVLVLGALAGPYFVACAIATGDPLYAINAHTVYYRAAEGADVSQPAGALSYVGRKFVEWPVASVDTAVRGLTTHPFGIKWRGLNYWHAGVGDILRALAIAGLIFWAFGKIGRLLLLILCGVLLPYMTTWPLGDGGAWRFTMPAYPFYLVAAFMGLQAVCAFSQDLVRGRLSRIQLGGLARRGVAVGVVFAVAVTLHHWAPYWIVRESLKAGESTSVAAGARDAVFLTGGWTPLVRTGTVTSRLSDGLRATLRVPLPERRPYQVVLRMDALPFADARPQRIRVFLDDQLVGVAQLEFIAERIGAHTIVLPPQARPGMKRLDLLAEYARPLGDAGDVFPEIPRTQHTAFRFWLARLTPQ